MVKANSGQVGRERKKGEQKEEGDKANRTFVYKQQRLFERRMPSVSLRLKVPHETVCHYLIINIDVILTVAVSCCRFFDAMKSQPRSLLMQRNGVLWTGHCLVMCGTILVATSYWALGFYGTFLGMSFDCLLLAVCRYA